MPPMHIVVCVKMVPDTTQVRIDPKTNTMMREGIPFITNPFDDHAVEEALALKDRYGARVTVISMGPAPAVTVIRKAIARGADGGILVSDRAFGGSDTLATTRVLAAALNRIAAETPVDLVVCGRQTIDGDTAQVGPGIAARLGYAQVTLVDRVIEMDGRSRRLVARTVFDDRYEVIEATLPAVITVVREINRPRYPSVPGWLSAEEAIIPVWNNDILKLKLDAIGLKGSPTWVKRIFAPPGKKGEVVKGSDGLKEKAIERVMDKLQEWSIWKAEGRMTEGWEPGGGAKEKTQG